MEKAIEGQQFFSLSIQAHQHNGYCCSCKHRLKSMHTSHVAVVAACVSTTFSPHAATTLTNYFSSLQEANPYWGHAQGQVSIKVNLISCSSRVWSGEGGRGRAEAESDDLADNRALHTISLLP